MVKTKQQNDEPLTKFTKIPETSGKIMLQLENGVVYLQSDFPLHFLGLIFHSVFFCSNQQRLGARTALGRKDRLERAIGVEKSSTQNGGTKGQLLVTLG